MSDEKFMMELADITDHEDGSATYAFNVSHGVNEIINELGLKLLLYCGMAHKSTDSVFEALLVEVDKNLDLIDSE
jgi:hypothetical protein